MLLVSRAIGIAYLSFVALVLGLKVVVGPLPGSNAPAPLPVGPEREPIEIVVAHGKENEAWIQEAAAVFEKTEPTVRGGRVHLTLQTIGSGEAVEGITNQSIKPVAINPSSSLQVVLLQDAWQREHGTPIIHDLAPVNRSPLVLIAWQERVDTLWPEGTNDLWSQLYDVLAGNGGWQSHGHPEWGPIKFGHTTPPTSNSGQQLLILFAYNYHNKTHSLTVQDVQDPGFQRWLDGVEHAVHRFGPSTGEFMREMLMFGPSQYDFAAVYEHIALNGIDSAINRQGQPLNIYYPPITMICDHPYAILSAPWVTDDQQAAAALFRDFLLTEEMQKLAVRDYGFRPARDGMSIGDDIDALFEKNERYGADEDTLPTVVEVPSAEVIKALIQLWEERDYE
jgi:hypothetical protein